MWGRIWIVMLGEKGKSIGHIHRKFISSEAVENKIRYIEKKYATSLDNSKLLYQKTIAK